MPSSPTRTRPEPESVTQIMTAKTNPRLPFDDRLDAAAESLPGSGLPWLGRLRADARAAYRETGLPGPKVEAWKYTNLNRLRRTGFAPETAPAKAVDTVPVGSALSIEAHQAVLVNGRFRPDLSSLPKAGSGVEVMGLADALAREPGLLEGRLGRIAPPAGMPLIALNTALAADGLVIRFRKGKESKTPIHVVSIGASGDKPVMFQPRLLVIGEEGSAGTILESHIAAGDGVYFSNGVTEIALERRAALRHYKLQNEHPSAFHLATTTGAFAEGAHYDSFVLQLGGRLARNEIHARLDGRRIECRLNGAYLLRGEQHVDNTTVIEHTAPECLSRELYKGVLDGMARGVFQGKILVHREAQKTDGHQLNKALLLSRGAEIDSKPELEIYADDVKCGHGATAGEIDDEALFYLQSRGIDAETARGLLVDAFVGEAIEQIGHEASRAAFRQMVDGWLTEGRSKNARDKDDGR
jgi:Fe-S cluster assembly protein SufD